MTVVKLPALAATPALQRLIQIMARLRDPEQGCNWDLAQTPVSLAPYTIEEAYEVIDAIARGDSADWREELGDLLLQVVFQAQLAQEQGLFDFDAVALSIADKLERRHPHIFRDGRLDLPRLDLTADEVSAQWGVIKAQEKALKAAAHGGELPPTAFLDKIGAGLPPLLRAEKLQARAGEVGYDWNDPRAVIAKLREEIDELEAALDEQLPQAALQDELGDILFCCVNIGRHLQVDSEQALLGGIAKFRRRFGHIEQQLGAKGVALADASLDDMEALWQAAKKVGL
ncbi:MAG: nucleoside triphosphate pyrophosphohydrolase [Pseudomonadota bacterium]